MRYSNLIFTVLILLFTLQSISAQNLHVVGKVVDENNKEALPYANIMFENYGLGTSSNRDGVFAFHIPDSLGNENLVVSYVGYYKKKIKINDLLKKQRINLKPKTEGLDEVSISHVKEENKFMYRPEWEEPMGIGNLNAGLYPSTIARFYPKPDEFSGETCYLDYIQIYFYPLDEQKGLSPKFRLHIYEVDENGLPGEDLLKNLLLEKKSGRSTLKVDLLGEKIRIPENGFFIGLEHLFIKENEYTEVKDYYINDSLVAQDFPYKRYAPIYKGTFTKKTEDLRVYFYQPEGWTDISNWEIAKRDSLDNYVAPVFKIKITD